MIHIWESIVKGTFGRVQSGYVKTELSHVGEGEGKGQGERRNRYSSKETKGPKGEKGNQNDWIIEGRAAQPLD